MVQCWQTPEPKANSSSLDASALPRDQEEFLHSFSHRGGLQPAPTRVCKATRQSRAGTGAGVRGRTQRPVGQGPAPAGPSTCGCRWGQDRDSGTVSTGVLQAIAGAQEGKATYNTKIAPMRSFRHLQTNFSLSEGKKDFEQRRAEALNTP